VTFTIRSGGSDTLRDVWEPVGPLPASVYWRRRWVAIASVLGVLVLLVWFVGAPLTDSGSTARPASRAALSAPQPAPPSPIAPAAAQQGAEGQGVAAPSTGPTPGPTPEPTPAPTAEATASPREPVPCTNEMLGVAAQADRPQHRVGERLPLRLVVTNTSDQPCVRDLDLARAEIVVWSGDGGQRLWSSNDCSNASGPDMRTLAPGQPVVFSVEWTGRTSTPGCADPRTVVPPGAYRVMTRVDDVISAPTPFLRNG
jgi:hypothetical protein